MLKCSLMGIGIKRTTAGYLISKEFKNWIDLYLLVKGSVKIV